MEQALMVSSGPQPMDAFAKTRVRGFLSHMQQYVGCHSVSMA